MIVSDITGQPGVGLAIGTVAERCAGRRTESLLYELHPGDPFAFMGGDRDSRCRGHAGGMDSGVARLYRGPDDNLREQ